MTSTTKFQSIDPRHTRHSYIWRNNDSRRMNVRIRQGEKMNLDGRKLRENLVSFSSSDRIFRRTMNRIVRFICELRSLSVVLKFRSYSKPSSEASKEGRMCLVFSSSAYYTHHSSRHIAAAAQPLLCRDRDTEQNVERFDQNYSMLQSFVSSFFLH